MGLSLESMRLMATQWRTRNQEYSGGVVLVWENAVYGWKNELRDAHQERPGAYAIDTDGAIFIAAGGNKNAGAERWDTVAPGI
ncbi:antirestriction protein ArdR [Pseudomonas guariconensis]|uniref:antirestriction protein ArdR n=1 Tax=Pseudomonas guariconensis TaxID=1288410 RepID=UPI00390638A1